MTPCDGAELGYYRICAKTQVLKNSSVKAWNYMNFSGIF